MKRFEIKLWDKVVRDEFSELVEASDDGEAWKIARRQRPQRRFHIIEIMELFH
jgi:hypothetical protein